MTTIRITRKAASWLHRSALIGLALLPGPALADDFPAFWQRFRAAVMAGDRQAVTGMTALPFMIDGQDLDAAGFLRHYDALFGPPAKACFRDAKPLFEDDAYLVFCGEQMYLFRAGAEGFRFAEVGAND